MPIASNWLLENRYKNFVKWRHGLDYPHQEVAILEWDDEAQAYSATCPELNFVSSFGQSREEAIANLKEAIQLMLEPIPDEFLEMAGSREIVELAL
jgi:predicted RNase H-like HicB family nuclease